MAAKKYKANIPVYEPYLIREAAYHRCSVCGYPFAADVFPSLNDAFAEHLINSHESGPRSADSSPIALHLVREATEKKQPL